MIGPASELSAQKVESELTALSGVHSVRTEEFTQKQRAKQARWTVRMKASSATAKREEGAEDAEEVGRLQSRLHVALCYSLHLVGPRDLRDQILVLLFLS